ncbi:MAG: DUF1573 domain-containing protein [Chitinophagales bacterium]|nr:DUF1573 domain-containing protein [Chitinophagales bacterium]
MKSLSTLVIVGLLALLGGSSFYIFKLSKQVSTLQQQIKDLEKETSPFAKIPENPLYDVKENQKGPITTIAFAKKEFDFGTVKENVLSNTSFTFTNTGTNPLLVSNAIGSCGCTVPEWPDKPILPGASGEIKVQFDSKDKFGTQVKTVTVKTNTEPNQTVLIIKANVLAKEQ